MEEPTEKDILVCLRIDEMPVPHTRSYKGSCEECNAALWVAFSSPTEPRRMCKRCALIAAAKELGGGKVAVTDKQIDDIVRVLGRK